MIPKFQGQMLMMPRRSIQSFVPQRVDQGDKYQIFCQTGIPPKDGENSSG